MPYKRKIAGIALTLAMLLGGGGAFAAQNPEYDRITEDMQTLRELVLLEPIDIQFKTREELQIWVDESLAEYPEEEQAIDERVNTILGFIEPGTDVGDLESAVRGEQIGGFYDPETDEMVVVLSLDTGELSANDEITFAHEVVHALQDQHFDLMEVQGNFDTITTDGYLAIKALIEGDATVGQIVYLIENPGLLEDVEAELEDYESPELDAAPLYYAETLLFPYDEGSTFVAEIFLEGGWDAVDDMYADPPTTTEQILHPEKYLEGEEGIVVTVDDPMPRLGDGWELLDEDVMGEFSTDVFLRNGGARGRDAGDASEGWGGDAYLVVGNDEETALIWESVWDTEDDAEEFFEILVETESERLGGEVEVQSSESHVRIIGEDYIADVHLSGDSVSYILTENIGTLDTITGISVAD